MKRWIRPKQSYTQHDIPNLLKEMPVKSSLKDGKMANLTTMRKRLQRRGEVGIVDETNGFGLDFVEKAESGF